MPGEAADPATGSESVALRPSTASAASGANRVDPARAQQDQAGPVRAAVFQQVDRAEQIVLDQLPAESSDRPRRQARWDSPRRRSPSRPQGALRSRWRANVADERP